MITRNDRPNRRSPREIWPLEVKNSHSTVAPPYALLQIVSCAKNDRGAAVYTVTRPDGTSGALYLVNSPVALAAVSGYGNATFIFPVPVRLHSETGAVVGASFGPVTDQWGIAAGGGYRLASAPIGGKAMVMPSGMGTHWGVVASGGISALSGISGSTLTPGSGTVQEYNSDGTIKSGVTETWYNWMNTAIPQHTPVLGNRESDGQIWVKVAPCGTLATS